MIKNYLSYYLILTLAAFEMAKQNKFNLTVPQKDTGPRKNLRLERKAFAIACQTTVTSKPSSISSSGIE
jgi:hypothetical protein